MGLGPQVDRIVLEELGQAEHAHAARLDQWTDETMRRLAARIRGHWESHGVVSICSPRRAGTHVLAVAPRGQSGPGSRFVFDATGFTGGCAAAWDKSVCRFVTCGGPEGSACATCPAGQVCRDHVCVDARIEQEAAARAAAQRRRAEANQAREEVERLRLLRTCRREQHQIGQRYDAWVARQARGEKPDCGFRLQAELGARAFPVPRGVAGAVLVGLAWARRVEVQAGVGFSAAHGVLLAQLPIRLYSRRWLDLLVVPRAGVGFGQGMVLAEAEAFLGVRLRVHRHLALYGLMGPGVAYTHKQDISRTSFTLPFWLGMEVRR